MKRLYSYAWLLIIPAALAAFFLLRPGGADPVRGKSPARPLDQETTPEIERAQDLALSDPQVIAYTSGRRSEVMGVFPAGQHFPPEAEGCSRAYCLQVQIYNYEENATVSAFVDVGSGRVLGVLHQPGLHGGVNQRLYDLAVEIIRNEPLVIGELGYQPNAADIRPWIGSLAGTNCGDPHPCLTAVFMDEAALDGRNLWAHVDLTTETFAGIAWSPTPGPDGSSLEFVPQGCVPSGSISRDGWTLNHEVTASDGLRVWDVGFNGMEVIQSAKLAEWHADYGNTGFIDAGGCGGGGGSQFTIYPYGDTQVIDIFQEQAIVGFEVVQDFRMPNWGANCNYRYEQRYQFYQDGRFRVVAGAYGRGCSANAIYRPLVRIDISVNGDLRDTFAVWDGSTWVDQTTEVWWQQGAPYAFDGSKYRVMDFDEQAGFQVGYYIEPGQGQFEDGGLGDDAFVYVVQTHSNEGGADLGTVGPCCYDDERQGPEQFINGESIADQDITIWYVPQFVTSAAAGSQYCWTVSGEPNPETYPCFGGPFFKPFFVFNYPEEIFVPISIR